MYCSFISVVDRSSKLLPKLGAAVFCLELLWSTDMSFADNWVTLNVGKIFKTSDTVNSESSVVSKIEVVYLFFTLSKSCFAGFLLWFSAGSFRNNLIYSLNTKIWNVYNQGCYL